MWGVYEFRNQLAIMIATAIEQYGDCILPEGRRKEYEAMGADALRMLLEFRLPSESFPFVTTMKKKQLVDALEASICIPMCAIAPWWLKYRGGGLGDPTIYPCVTALYKDLDLDEKETDVGRASYMVEKIQELGNRYPAMISQAQRDISAEDLECAEGTPDSEKPFVIQSHLFTHRMLPEGFNSHTVHRFRDFPNGSMRFYKSQEMQ
jgi:hypothetical protein